MRIVCIGGGPAGLYFALLMKKQDPRARGRRGRAQPALRHLRLGRRVLRPDARQPATRPTPTTARADPRRVQPLGRHRGPLQGRTITLGRPRLLRHRPQAPAQHPAGALRGARRRAGVRDRRADDDDAARVRRRPRHRQRRPQQPHPHALRRDASSPTSTCAAAASSGSARSKLFDAFTFAFEETEHGWFQAHAYQFDDETSTFIVETPEDVWQRAGLDRMEQEEAIAFCEQLFARYLDGHALMSNAAHLRGSAQLDPLSARRLRHVGALDRRRRQARAGRADGRRRAHRALLDRLGHQARARGRDRARALHRQRSRGDLGRRAARLRGACAASKC